MYDLIDQPVARLANGSRFVLWAVRCWTRAMRRQICPAAALAPAFAKMGVLPALPDVHMAMALLNRDGLESLSLAVMDARHIAEDEAMLMALWHDVAAGDRERARAVLRLIVEEGSIEPILSAMAQATGKLHAMELAPTGFAPDEKIVR